VRFLLVVMLLGALAGCIKPRLLGPTPGGPSGPGPDAIDLGIGVTKKGFYVALGGSFLNPDGTPVPGGTRPGGPTVATLDVEALLAFLARLPPGKRSRVSLTVEEGIPPAVVDALAARMRERDVEAVVERTWSVQP
jgi:hypothetical protein